MVNGTPDGGLHCLRACVVHSAVRHLATVSFFSSRENIIGTLIRRGDEGRERSAMYLFL